MIKCSVLFKELRTLKIRMPKVSNKKHVYVLLNRVFCLKDLVRQSSKVGNLQRQPSKV